jgi:hypothetical protein
VSPEDQLAIMSARLSEILDKAKSLHCATETAQLADIMWFGGELDDLRLPPDQDAFWRDRIAVLYRDVCMRLSDLESVFENHPATPDNREIGDLERWVEGCGQRLHELWEEIEAEELRFVLAYPDVLLGRSEPHPPHIEQLVKSFREASDVCRRLSGTAPSRLLDLAAALVELARDLGSRPETAEDAPRAAELAVALFRDTARAQPQASRQKLGTSLVVLAQSLLATANIEEATVAAVAASELVGPDEMPPEVLGLTSAL